MPLYRSRRPTDSTPKEVQKVVRNVRFEKKRADETRFVSYDFEKAFIDDVDVDVAAEAMLSCWDTRAEN
jgi:hypothetical protein